LKIFPEVMLHAVLVWICHGKLFWIFGWIGRECMGSLPECALNTCLIDALSASGQEHRRKSFWSRSRVLNCVRIETGFESQAQIRA